MIRPDSSEQDIVSWVNSNYQTARSARSIFERVWFTNMAFFFGKQWVVWGQGGSYQYARMIEPPTPSWRVRLVINRIRGYVSREINRLHSTRPRGYVMPASDEASDRAKAKVGEQLYSYLDSLTDLEIQQTIATLWTCFTGNGYLKVSYDPGPDPSSGYMGKICVEAVSPFNILVPNLDEPLLTNQPWVMHCVVKDPAWVKAVYGVSLNPEDSHSSDLLEERMMNAMNLHERKAVTTGILIKEVWIKPCFDFPEGAVVTVAQDKVLKATTPEQENPLEELLEQEKEEEASDYWIPFPYEHKEYPFHQRIHTLANRFYATTFVEDLVSLQKQFNRGVSQIIEVVNKLSRPVWVVPKGSLDVRTMTSEPGAIYQYNPGAQPPQQVAPAPLPPQVMQLVELTSNEMNNAASQHEVSQGSVPPNVEAATAISYLQEQDSAGLFMATRFLEKSYENIGRQMLSLVAQFWDAERMIKVVGTNKNFEAFLFKGTDLGKNTDFRVVPGSATPMSRAAKKAELMELIKMGAIPVAKGLQYLDMPELGALYEELQIDYNQARRENLKMSNGIDVEVNHNDEHLIHISEHDDFTKTQEYENLDPQIQAFFRTHTYNHMKIVTYLFGLQPQVQEQQQMLMQYGGIDPTYEMELRRLVTLLKSTGGQVPPQQSPPPTNQAA